MTYSVVAFDPDTGRYGVAVQSHSFHVGRSVPWARPGVGAVATQATTDTSYGPRGLDLLAGGVHAAAALREMLAIDTGSARRQVAIVGNGGAVAAHTGAECVRYASHITGSSWSVQGNLLARKSVVPAMAEAYRSATGSFADRLLSVLDAAEAEGGDLRGRQSAHLRVVGATRETTEHEGAFDAEETIDLGVADHPDPVTELRRLVELDRAEGSLRRARRAAEDGKREEALRQLKALDHIPHGTETDFWRALVLARIDHWNDATDVMAGALSANPAFGEVLVRLGERDPFALEIRRRIAGRDQLIGS